MCPQLDGVLSCHNATSSGCPPMRLRASGCERAAQKDKVLPWQHNASFTTCPNYGKDSNSAQKEEWQKNCRLLT
eukprot:scaffold250965_cov37-Prasinocladus_malaysianus.AAC.2